MLYQPLRFFVQQPVEAVQPVVLRPASRFDAVDQVIVKISRASLLQLLIEDLVPVFLRFEEGVMQFCSEGIRFPNLGN